MAPPIGARVLSGGEEGFDRYQLDRPVATFKRYTVWSAWDVRLGRPVTFTVITPATSYGAASDVDVDAAAARARAAAGVTSRAIVATLDVFETADRVYVVNDVVSAPTLRARVTNGGPLSARAASTVARFLLEGIRDAHERGVVHGAITPDVVFVFEDDSAKLSGLGWSPLHDFATLADDAGRYAAPELRSGSPVGPPVDYWGVGATLHFALHGKPPGGPRLPQQGTAPLSVRRLDAIIDPLLSVEPQQRPAPDAVLDRLDKLRSSNPAPTRERAVPTVVRDAETVPISLSESIRHRPDRTRWKSATVAVVALLLLTAAVAIARHEMSTRSRGAAPIEAPTSTIGQSSGATAIQAVTASTTATVPIPTSTSVAPATPSPGSTPPTTANQTPSSPSPAPPGWVLYTDPQTRYRVAKPQDWTIRPVTDFRTDFVDPASTAFVRIEWTDQPGPDPVQAWRDLARSFSTRQDGYQQLRLEPSNFKGHDAAEWEFLYLDRGVVRHALDIGMLTGRYGAALFAVSPENRWQELQSTLNVFRSTFEPPT